MAGNIQEPTYGMAGAEMIGMRVRDDGRAHVSTSPPREDLCAEAPACRHRIVTDEVDIDRVHKPHRQLLHIRRSAGMRPIVTAATTGRERQQDRNGGVSA